jgi:hypothetical protein
MAITKVQDIKSPIIWLYFFAGIRNLNRLLVSSKKKKKKTTSNAVVRDIGQEYRTQTGWSFGSSSTSSF